MKKIFYSFSEPDLMHYEMENKSKKLSSLFSNENAQYFGNIPNFKNKMQSRISTHKINKNFASLETSSPKNSNYIKNFDFLREEKISAPKMKLRMRSFSEVVLSDCEKKTLFSIKLRNLKKIMDANLFEIIEWISLSIKTHDIEKITEISLMKNIVEVSITIIIKSIEAIDLTELCYIINSVNKIIQKYSDHFSRNQIFRKKSSDSLTPIPSNNNGVRYSAQLVPTFMNESFISFKSADTSWRNSCIASNKNLSIKTLLPFLLDDIKSPHALKKSEENSFEAQISISPGKGSLAESVETSEKEEKNKIFTNIFKCLSLLKAHIRTLEYFIAFHHVLYNCYRFENSKQLQRSSSIMKVSLVKEDLLNAQSFSHYCEIQNILHNDNEKVFLWDLYEKNEENIILMKKIENLDNFLAKNEVSTSFKKCFKKINENFCIQNDDTFNQKNFFLRRFLQTKLKRWENANKLEAAKIKKNMMCSLEIEKVVCKLCERKIMAKLLKDHSKICKMKIELGMSLNMKIEFFKKNYIETIFIWKRTVKLSTSILRQRIRVLEKKLCTKKSPINAYPKIGITPVNSFEEFEAFVNFEVSDGEGKKKSNNPSISSHVFQSEKKRNGILDKDELKDIDTNYKITKKNQGIIENNKVNQVCELILEIFSAFMKNWNKLKETKYKKLNKFIEQHSQKINSLIKDLTFFTSDKLNVIMAMQSDIDDFLNKRKTYYNYENELQNLGEFESRNNSRKVSKFKELHSSQMQSESLRSDFFSGSSKILKSGLISPFVKDLSDPLNDESERSKKLLKLVNVCNESESLKRIPSFEKFDLHEKSSENFENLSKSTSKELKNKKVSKSNKIISYNEDSPKSGKKLLLKIHKSFCGRVELDSNMETSKILNHVFFPSNISINLEREYTYSENGSPLLSPKSKRKFLNWRGEITNYQKQDCFFFSENFFESQSLLPYGEQNPKDIIQTINIEDFKFIKLISKGAYGRVWMVERKATDDIYAMKIVNFADKMSKNHLDSITKENEIFRQLNGELAVKAVFTFVYQNFICFVMEYMIGGDLGSQLEKYSRFDENVARFYISEIILAVEHLHSQKIIHRDLKPDNILLDSKGHIKLTDFGLSDLGFFIQHKTKAKGINHTSEIYKKINIISSYNLANNIKENKSAVEASHYNIAKSFKEINRLNTANSIERLDINDSDSKMMISRKTIRPHNKLVGTPDYMAPEILEGEGLLNPVLDWWSVGIMLFEFLVGVPPFNDENIDLVFDNIRNNRVPWEAIEIYGEDNFKEDGISINAKNLIDRFLDPNPKTRLGSKGINQIKNHPFFKDVEWANLKNQDAPLKPVFKDNRDISNFEKTKHYEENEKDNPFFSSKGNQQNMKATKMLTSTLRPLRRLDILDEENQKEGAELEKTKKLIDDELTGLLLKSKNSSDSFSSSIYSFKDQREMDKIEN